MRHKHYTLYGASDEFGKFVDFIKRFEAGIEAETAEPVDIYFNPGNDTMGVPDNWFPLPDARVHCKRCWNLCEQEPSEPIRKMKST